MTQILGTGGIDGGSRSAMLSRSALLLSSFVLFRTSTAFTLPFSTTTGHPTSTQATSYRCPTALSSASGAGDDFPKLQFNRDSAGVSSAIPPRRKRHQSREKAKSKKKKSKTSRQPRDGPLTASDVGHHVASQYVNGQGGLFKVTDARRKRLETASQAFQTDQSHRKHVEYLKKLDRHPALVLNADYQPLSLLPLSLWCWQDAVKAIFSGKVTVVDVYPDVYIRAVNLDMPLPSVIALNEYVPQKDQTPAFTRRNVFLRDSYRCQYCADLFRTPDLTLDHFVPRMMGGKLEWENAVSCCKKCNGKKGSVPPSKLRSIGMKVLRPPRVPTQWELALEARKMVPRRVHPTWAPYLGIVQQPEIRISGHRKQESGGVEGIFDDSELA